MIGVGLSRCLGSVLLIGAVSAPPPAWAQYRGELVKFAYKSCPGGSLPAEGQLLKIADYPGLFETIGAAYGGDGTTSFALPDPLSNQSPFTVNRYCIAVWGIFPPRN